jgi:hypothetical protein
VIFATNIGLPVHFIPRMFAEKAGIEFRFAQMAAGNRRAFFRSFALKHS